MYPSSLFKRKRKKSLTPPCQRWPESLFQTPTPLLFQNFWIRIRVRKVYKFENPTPFQIRANIDPTEIYPCFYSRNDHADACYCRNWKLTPDLGPVFSQNKDSGSGSGCESKTQNPSGVDSGNPDSWPPLLRTCRGFRWELRRKYPAAFW